MVTRPCLIIGASGDIGEAIAHKLIGNGRPVALTHSPRSGPTASLADIGDKGKWYAVDVRDAKSINQLVADVQKDFKQPPDLVYSAGITKDAGLSLISDETWDAVIATNLSGAFYAARALSKPLMATGNGRIIFMGSVTAAKGNAGQLSYAATKGALESMCRVIAKELGRFGVTCNVVAPGAIDSRMLNDIPAPALDAFKKNIPLRRLGKTDEVASLVSFLLSEEGQYVTGQSIYIDGGLTAV
jgi:Dehydrogenases with different specificities (related to short-chain alcohol dehydrogenases)